jgi:uncharacterized membrane protein
MLYPSLLAVHVLSGIFWGGGAIIAGLFLMPSVIKAGPAGGAVMGNLIQIKFSAWMTVGAFASILSGLGMIAIQASNNSAWLRSPEGICLELGGLLALGAFGIGLRVQKPQAERLAAIGAAVAKAGGPPSAQQAADIADAQARMARAGRIGAYHILAASALMGMHTLFR